MTDNNIESPSKSYLDKIKITEFSDIQKLSEVSPESDVDALKRIVKKYALQHVIDNQKDKYDETDEITITKDNAHRIIFGTHQDVLMMGSSHGVLILDNGDICSVKEDRTGSSYSGVVIYRDEECANEMKALYQKNKHKFDELKSKNKVPRFIYDGSFDTLFFPEGHFYTIHCLERDVDEFQHFLCNIYDEYYEIAKKHSLDFLFQTWYSLTMKHYWDGEENEDDYVFIASDPLEMDDIIFARDHGIMPVEWIEDYQDFLQNQLEDWYCDKEDQYPFSRTDEEQEELVQWLNRVGTKEYQEEQMAVWEKYKIDSGYRRRHPTW